MKAYRDHFQCQEGAEGSSFLQPPTLVLAPTRQQLTGKFSRSKTKALESSRRRLQMAFLRKKEMSPLL